MTQRKVPRVTLIDSVVQQMEDAIISGEYPPNSKLPGEEELSNELEVSRPVVREALARLRERGHVTTINGRGTFVREAQIDAISETLLRQLRLHVGTRIGVDDLYEARRTIELGATGLAAVRATGQDLEGIAAYLERMKASSPADPAGYTAADVGFHLAIAEATHNPLYPLLVSPLVDLIVSGMYQSVTSIRAGMQSGVEDHSAILEHLRGHDQDGAMRAMEEHLRGSREKHPGFVIAAGAGVSAEEH